MRKTILRASCVVFGVWAAAAAGTALSQTAAEPPPGPLPQAPGMTPALVPPPAPDAIPVAGQVAPPVPLVPLAAQPPTATPNAHPVPPAPVPGGPVVPANVNLPPAPLPRPTMTPSMAPPMTPPMTPPMQPAPAAAPPMQSPAMPPTPPPAPLTAQPAMAPPLVPVAPPPPALAPMPSAPAAPPTAAAPGPLPPASQSPCLLVEKRGPEVINLGKPLSYEIVVRNAGQAPVHNVRAEDELPAHVRYAGGEPTAEVGPNRLVWNLGTLEPNAERRVRVDLQPAGEGEIRATATVTFTTAAALRTMVVHPRLAMTMRGPESATAGDPVPFQIQVSNPGSGPVTNLILRAKLPDGLTHPQGQIVEADLGTVGPGESRSVTLTTTAARGGHYVNEVVASADGGLEAHAQSAVQVLGATLQVRRGGPVKCYLKSEVGFDLEVQNTGSAPAADVLMTDALPAGLDFVSATDGGTFDPASRTVNWRLSALPPGGRRNVGYRVKATGLGEHAVRALARADRGAEARADGTFTVEGIPALMLEVVDLEDPIEAGGELTYEVRVVNQGSCPCTNIQITAAVPEGMLAKEGTGPSAYRAQGAQVAFDPLPKLATKADVVYRIKVRGVQPGDYRFRVQMTCDQLRQPVVKEEASRVYKDGQ